MTTMSVTPGSYPYQNEPIWSKSEKAIARTAFDAALGRELHELIQEAKKMASQIQQPPDLWDLEHYLSERRNRDQSQVRVPLLATHARLGDTSPRRPSERKSCRLAARQVGIYPFLR